MNATDKMRSNPGKGNPANATNGREPTTQAAQSASPGRCDDRMKVPIHRDGPDAVVWFKLFPARWAAMAMREPDNAKLGERVRKIILALCEQEQGMDDFADAVTMTTLESMRAASEHAKKAADVRWKKQGGGCSSNPQASTSDGSGCSGNARRGYLEDERRREEKRIMRESHEPLAAGAAALSQIEIPSLEEVKAFGAEHGFPPERVAKFYRHYEACGWRDAQGQPVLNWKGKVSSWMNRPELAQPGAVPAPISAEDARRKDDAERRKRTIREGAEKIVAMQSWIDSGVDTPEKHPYGHNPPEEIANAREEIEKKYGMPGLDELSKVTAVVTEEKRLEAERRKARA